MASFSIVGPIEIPVEVRPGGKLIDRSFLGEFWDEAGCMDRVGCYVFAIRNRGVLPYYAGRTTNSFGAECFEPHKITKYQDALTHVRRGSPVMFFAVLDINRGRRSGSAIRMLEERLIGLGLQRNERMTNVSGTRRDDLIVRGVMGGTGGGRRPGAANQFRTMMGL
jgi:hypothetical protein